MSICMHARIYPSHALFIINLFSKNNCQDGYPASPRKSLCWGRETNLSLLHRLETCIMGLWWRKVKAKYHKYTSDSGKQVPPPSLSPCFAKLQTQQHFALSSSFWCILTNSFCRVVFFLSFFCTACKNNFQEFTSLWKSISMWNVGSMEVFSCCILGTEPKFTRSLRAVPVLPAFIPQLPQSSRRMFCAWLAQGPASWGSGAGKEEIFTLYFYPLILKDQRTGFITQARGVVKRFSSLTKWEHHLLI